MSKYFAPGNTLKVATLRPGKMVGTTGACLGDFREFDDFQKLSAKERNSRSEKN